MTEKLKQFLTPYKIAYQAFCEYYTPEFVDLHMNNDLEEISNSLDKGESEDSIKARMVPPRIFILFPKVTVTNELGESRVIYDLLVSIKILQHTVEILGTRLTYTLEEARNWIISLSGNIESWYRHSHLYAATSDMTNFCLGRGPLSETTYNDELRVNNPKEYFGLLAFELDNYVKIESLSGGPYIRLHDGTTVTNFHPSQIPINDTILSNLDMQILKKFLSTESDAIHSDGQKLFVGMSFPDFHAAISNIYNSLPDRDQINTSLGYYQDGVFYMKTSNRPTNTKSLISRAVDRANSTFHVKFKGKELKYNIMDISNEQVTKYYNFYPLLKALRMYNCLNVSLNHELKSLCVSEQTQEQS